MSVVLDEVELMERSSPDALEDKSVRGRIGEIIELLIKNGHGESATASRLRQLAHNS